MAQNGMISIGFKVETGKDGLRQLMVDADGLRKVMEANVETAKKLTSKYIDLAAAVTTFSGIKDAVGGLHNALSGLTAESEEFAASMKAANTMAGKDAEGFAALKSEVAELATVVPIARDQLADGLYQVISNGVPEGNWMDYLTASARSAVGGMADIGKVVGVTATVIKNYGLEWSEAAAIQDKIQLTAKNGVTSFEQLAEALPRVTGNAATLGVGIDELMGLFATLTGVSGNTAEVSTQLAAILGSLVKPSSEAAKMAQEMGIQFDAAAIKSAGGLEQFLKSLDESVKGYSAASGVLEQEVYGKLFGSAEALRALVPLQGELAEKFTENVSAMRDSAGTMDAAFGEMSSTGASALQSIKNEIAAVVDVVAGFISPAMPFLEMGAAAGETFANIKTLTEAVKQFHLINKVAHVSSAALSGVVKLLGVRSGEGAVLVRVFSNALKGGAQSALAFKVALKGLLITSGVGIAIWALVEAISYFTGKADEGAAAADRLTDAEKRMARSEEMAAELQKTESDARNEAMASLELYKSKLETFNGTQEEEQRLVGELNRTYGETMGYFSSVSDWYKALVSNSEAYCRQMVAEAKTRRLANQIAEIEEKRDNVLRDEYGNARYYSTERHPERVRIPAEDVEMNTNPMNSYPGVGVSPYIDKTTGKPAFRDGNGEFTAIRMVNNSDHDKATETVEGYNRQIAALRGNLKAAHEEAAKGMPVMGAAAPPGGTFPVPPPRSTTGNRGGGTTNPEAPEGSMGYIKNRMSEIDTRISYSIDPDEIYRLQKEKLALAKELKELELPVRLAATREEWLKMTGEIPPVEISVEVDTGTLPQQLQDLLRGVDSGEPLPATLSTAERLRETLGTAERLRETLGTVGDAASRAGDAFSGMGRAFEVPALDVMGLLAQAVATMAMGYAQATAESGKLGPFGWLGFAATGLATLATMVSQVKGMAAFADGGVVYGPTLGLVGEYAGARSNPEVIAPLSRLREMIGENPGRAVVVGGEMRVSGRDLVAALENQTRVARKSGRRYNL